jgi:uncharacterized membrane protein YfcA
VPPGRDPGLRKCGDRRGDEHRCQRGGRAHRRSQARPGGPGRLAHRAWTISPSVAAAFVGGYFGGRVPEALLLAGIAAALLWNGVQLVFEVGAPPRARNPRAAAALAGAVIGLIGGAVRLILGTRRMPALLGRVGLPPVRAVGTNLVVGFFLGVAGFLGHALQLEVDWPVLAVSIAAAVPGAWLGARLTRRMSERLLNGRSAPRSSRLGS